MLKAMRWLITLTAWLIIFLLLSLLLILASGLTNRPLASNPAPLTAASAQTGKQLLKRVATALNRTESLQVLTIQEQELDALLALPNRSVRSLRFDGAITEQHIQLGVRLKLPDNPFVQYWGFDLLIPPTTQGLRAKTLIWGNFELPGEWLIPSLVSVGDHLLGRHLFEYPDRGDTGDIAKLLQSFKQLKLKPQKAWIVLQGSSDFKQQVARISDGLKNFSAEQNLFSDTTLTQYYFNQLLAIEKTFPRGSSVSLETLIKRLFTEVSINSTDSDAAIHNHSALAALGIYRGSYHFEKLFGRISPEGYKEQYVPIRVELSGRRDLRLHFLYSSTLQLMANRGAAFSIGEYKELLDSNTGGSGFSFVDLAADRAGILFAQQATDEATARDFQFHVIATIEDGLLPPLSTLRERHLNEGIGREVFEQSYGDIESDLYQQQVGEIDQLLQQQPIYNP